MDGHSGNMAARFFMLLMVVFIVLFSGAVYWADYRQEMRQAEELGRAVAQAADEQINGSLRTVDLMLQYAADHVAARPDDLPAIENTLALQAAAVPEVEQLLVTDAWGRRIAASRASPAFQAVAGENFFSVQQSIFQFRNVVIDGPLASERGARIVVSRPIIGRDETFLGVVAAVLEPRFFGGPLQQLAPERVASTTLFNVNGVVLSHFPDAGLVGDSLAGTRLFTHELRTNSAGVWRSRGEGEGGDALVAWRSLANYPLIVAAGIPLDAVVSDWWNATRRNLLIETGFVLILAFVGRMLYRREQVLARTARDLIKLNAELEERVAERTENLTREVAERRRVEEALRDAKEAAEAASLSKSRFLAVASHDLRQPVQALNLYANVLAGKALEPEVAGIVQRMRASTGALAGLLDSLLDISKLDANVVNPQTRPVPLGVMLTRLWDDFSPVAETAGVSLSMVPGERWVWSDPALLERIIQNLISNAIRYTPAGGKILVGCRPRGNRVAVQVWDTGIGIPSDKADEVFQEFTQLGEAQGRRQGLGLGLAIVRRLVRLLGHSISLRSAPGKGSMFELVVARAHPAQDTAPGGPGAVAVGDWVLVVDDEPEVRHSLGLQLSVWGARVLEAGDEAEALEACGRAPISALVADLRLNGEVVGIQLAERIRQRLGRPLPVVLLTGDTEAHRLREAVASGLRLLHKPVRPEELRQALFG